MGKCKDCGAETKCNVWTEEYFQCRDCAEKEMLEIEKDCE